MVQTLTRTAFSAWREACGLDIDECAEMLGKTKQMVLYLEHGRTSDGRPVVPQIDTRKLMTAIFKGIDLKAWPI